VHHQEVVVVELEPFRVDRGAYPVGLTQRAVVLDPHGCLRAIEVENQVLTECCPLTVSC
jgi:hypothetical protein